MRNRFRAAALCLAAVLCLSACAAGGDAVRVERMDSLTVAATVADRFAGVVVSDNVVQVGREMDKTIKELLVKEGDQVTQGQKLFHYDTDALNLALDKQELEQDRLEADIKSLKASVTTIKKDIEDLKKSKKDTGAKELELRQVEMELRQREYEEDILAADIKNTKQMLKNVNVYSPVTGTVRAVDEMDPDAYIVIQQSGAYRVKGTLNEMSMNMGVMEGVGVTVISRLDPEKTWTGTVELVDYENAQQSDPNQMIMGPSDGMTTSTSYPFYIALEHTEGLLLGQHVYIQLSGTELPEGNYLPYSYLMDIVTDELGNSTAQVWSVGEAGTLQKRTVTLGIYDMATGSYEILEGLTESDYVADPADPACREGAAVIKPAEPVEEFTEPSGTDEIDLEEPIGGDPMGIEPVEDPFVPTETDPTETEPTETEPTETEPQETTRPNPLLNWGHKG